MSPTGKMRGSGNHDAGCAPEMGDKKPQYFRGKTPGRELLSEYEDFGNALRSLGRFLDDVYNRKRIHSSLGHLTRAEFEGQVREKHFVCACVRVPMDRRFRIRLQGSHFQDLTKLNARARCLTRRQIFAMHSFEWREKKSQRVSGKVIT